MRKACRSYRVYFTKPTVEELAAGDYLIDHSIISYLIDPEGHFLDYFGKSLSKSEMEDKMSAAIGAWERERKWRPILPMRIADFAFGPPDAKREIKERV